MDAEDETINPNPTRNTVVSGVEMSVTVGIVKLVSRVVSIIKKDKAHRVQHISNWKRSLS